MWNSVICIIASVRRFLVRASMWAAVLQSTASQKSRAILLGLEGSGRTGCLLPGRTLQLYVIFPLRLLRLSVGFFFIVSENLMETIKEVKNISTCLISISSLNRQFMCFHLSLPEFKKFRTSAGTQPSVDIGYRPFPTCSSPSGDVGCEGQRAACWGPPWVQAQDSTLAVSCGQGA